MSRSTKKPYYTDQQRGCTKKSKRDANRAVRDLKVEDTPKNGKAYRKESNPYNIRDWSFFSKDKKATRK